MTDSQRIKITVVRPALSQRRNERQLQLSDVSKDLLLLFYGETGAGADFRDDAEDAEGVGVVLVSKADPNFPDEEEFTSLAFVQEA